MATIQIRIDDDIKTAADSLFNNLGLDTSTAIRMFISAAIARDGLPFTVKRRNLHGPYKTAEEAVAAMLDD